MDAYSASSVSSAEVVSALLRPSMMSKAGMRLSTAGIQYNPARRGLQPNRAGLLVVPMDAYSASSVISAEVVSALLSPSMMSKAPGSAAN